MEKNCIITGATIPSAFFPQTRATQPAPNITVRGVRIQKVFVFVEDQPFLWFIWSVYAVSVLELFNIQFENDHGIYISYPVMDLR